MIGLSVILTFSSMCLLVKIDENANAINIEVQNQMSNNVTFNIPVQLGMNLISVPLVQDNTSILAVLDDNGGDTTWDYAQWYNITDTADPWKSYSPFWPPVLNDLHNITHTMGIRLNITDIGSDSVLTVNGSLPSTITIPLYKGWNMVGYPARYERLTVKDVKQSTGNLIVEITNDTGVVYDDNYLLKRGEGYWVNVSANCTWTIFNGVADHTPIRINSNADFDEAHGVVNWDTGDGSEGNPWLIKDWDINGTGYGFCLYIGNTTDYFEVINCSLHNASNVNYSAYFLNTGAILFYVQNSALSNNTVVNNRFGFRFYLISNATIENNTASNNQVGFRFSWSDNNTIVNNNASFNTEGSFEFSGSHNNTITNNSASFNECGFLIYDSSNNTITYNNASSNTERSFYLSSSNHNIR